MLGVEWIPVMEDHLEGLAAQHWGPTDSRNPGQALGGGGQGRGAWSCHFEVPDVCGETIRPEVSLASALLHTPCHLISLSPLPAPRFVNLPRLLYEVRRRQECDSVDTHAFFLLSPHP